MQLPFTCTNAPGEYATAEFLASTVQAQAKFKTSPPASGRPKPWRYSFHFATGFTGFSGTIAGKLFKRNGVGEVLAPGYSAFPETRPAAVP